METIKLAIMMNPVRDILTNKIVGFERPQRDSLFIHQNCKLSIIIRKNQEVIEIGNILNVNEDYQKIKNVWWQICEIQLNENTSHDFIIDYICGDEGPFFNYLNGKLYSNNGLNSGCEWNGILVRNWNCVRQISNQINSEEKWK